MADYKEQDRKKIIDFLMSNGGTATLPVSVPHC